MVEVAKPRNPMKRDIQDQLKTKQKIEKDKETVRPTVINDHLIREYMVEYNRENKIFDDDEREIWELTHLSLSFKSKLSIDLNNYNRRDFNQISSKSTI